MNDDKVKQEIQELTNIVYLKDYKKPVEASNPDVLPPDYSDDYYNYIDDISLSVAFDVTELLMEYGFSIEDVPKAGYDLMMVIESVKSIMHRSQGEYYPLQEISEDLFEIDDPESLVEGFLNGE